MVSFYNKYRHQHKIAFPKSIKLQFQTIDFYIAKCEGEKKLERYRAEKLPIYGLRGGELLLLLLLLLLPLKGLLGLRLLDILRGTLRGLGDEE